MTPPSVESFRCAAASADDDEPLDATAPDDARWLFVEQAGGWGPKVTLAHRDRAVRVQLIRRSGARPAPGPARVFWAEVEATGGCALRAGTVTDPAEAADLDPAELEPYGGPLLLVCTHGRRDVCCAERGRPVAAALAARWPDATWETSHLGGHRFAATLIVLPAGLTLGRVGPGSGPGGAVDAVTAVLAGEWPDDVVRGRAGSSARRQAAEAHVRRESGLRQLTDVRVGEDDGEVVTVTTPTGPVRVRIEPGPGVRRRQSCDKPDLKPAATWVCRTV